MAREIEIKVRVKDSTRFVEFLTAEAEFLGEQHQVDEYFTPSDRDFTAVRPVNEWLRLRSETHWPARSGETSEVSESLTSEVKEERAARNRRSSLNYKLWHRDPVDGRSLYADEYETPIESIEALREIFTALKFRKLCTVDKVRKTWRISVVIPDRFADGASAKQDRESSSSDQRSLATTRSADSPAGSPMSVSRQAGSGSRMTKTETYEIALDHVQDLGDFVEVELIGETTDTVDAVLNRMLVFLHDHGLEITGRDQVGYPYLLLFGNAKQ